MVLEQLFFQTFTKNRPVAGVEVASGGWGLHRHTPSVIRLNYSYTSYSNTSPNLDIVAF